MKNRILILLTMVFVFACSSLVSAKVEIGMSGSTVQSVQYMLQDAGYLSGGADGVFGSGTQAAVEQFQADHGLDVDGIVGSATMAALSEASGRPIPDESDGGYQHTIIPLGTQLYIEGYGYAIADDTGGAIVGNRIDLGMDSRAEALEFGRQDVVVHIL